MSSSPIQWDGAGKRPWMQNEPITSYARNQGNSEKIYPLDSSGSSSSPSANLYCVRQPNNSYYCAQKNADAQNGVNGSSYNKLPDGAVVITRSLNV